MLNHAVKGWQEAQGGKGPPHTATCSPVSPLLGYAGTPKMGQPPSSPRRADGDKHGCRRSARTFTAASRRRGAKGRATRERGERRRQDGGEKEREKGRKKNKAGCCRGGARGAGSSKGWEACSHGRRRQAGLGKAAAKLQLVCPVSGGCANLRFFTGGELPCNPFEVFFPPPQEGKVQESVAARPAPCAVGSRGKAAAPRASWLRQPPSHSGSVPMPAAELGRQEPLWLL